MNVGEVDEPDNGRGRCWFKALLVAVMLWPTYSELEVDAAEPVGSEISFSRQILPILAEASRAMNIDPLLLMIPQEQKGNSESSVQMMPSLVSMEKIIPFLQMCLRRLGMHENPVKSTISNITSFGTPHENSVW